ncbi:MAG: hypothetical protein M3Z02_04415 [Actinomycetota bacterium]|nr:hypothetical protein [Actinomycetota bacterium]
MVLAPDPQPDAPGGTRTVPQQRPSDATWTMPAGHAARYGGRQHADATPDRSGAAGQRIVLAEDVELLGRSEGSGYIDEHHLARTASGRVVQLTDLLFLVAEAGGRDGATDEEVAAKVSEGYGRAVSADNVRVLADKLRPLGILAAADGSMPDVVEPDPLLALKLRSTLLGPDGVRRLTMAFRPLFFLPIVATALVGLVGMDLWLFLSHGLAQGVREALNKPTLFLLAFGLVVISAAFHECGHATACTVGGGRPGRMGAGIYLMWPAFYTDVTDAYRLDRKARLRTDLGGVYFSCLLVLGLGGAYLLTHFEPLLLIAFLMQIEVVHQLLPFLRLDGYYVVSDLVGVPDLFKRTGPVLKSMVPGHKPEPSVLELKRWVRTVVRVWVLVVVPILLLNVGMILLNFPRLVGSAWDSGAKLVGEISHASVVMVVIDVIQLVFLVIPLLGLGWTFGRLGMQLARKGWATSAGSGPKRAGFLAAAALVLGGLALAWWPDARYTPYRPGERGTVEDQAQALAYVGQGTPLFRSPTEAQQPLPPLPPKLADAYGTAGHPIGETPATGTSGGPAPSGPSGVAPSAVPSVVPTASASATATATTSPRPSASASATASVSPTR